METPTPNPHPTWLEIDLSAVRHNTKAVLQRTRVDLMAVVKCDAYGFGAVEVAKAELAAGASQLAVARFAEGLALRKENISAPILVFGYCTPEETDFAPYLNLSLTIHNADSLEAVINRTRGHENPAHVHVKVDTGFGRLGFTPADIPTVFEVLAKATNVVVDGLYSHLAFADEVPDHPVTRQQITAFNDVVQTLNNLGQCPPWLHLANSAAAWGIPESRFNLTRVGTALLGMKPFYFQPLPTELERVLAWKCRLASCKQFPAGTGISYGHTYHTSPNEWIGTLPVGYGDGFRRNQENLVLIDGKRAKVVGRVCNDMCMVSLPEPYPVGTEVTLIGAQKKESILTDELIDRWHTSQADITCGINARVPRLYLNG